MKKRLLGIISFALALICLAGCAVKNEDGEKPVFIKNDPRGPYTVTDGKSFYFDMDDSYIAIYSADDMKEPSQSFNHDGLEEPAYSLDGLRFEDVNFDGFPDLLVPAYKAATLQMYYGFLWDNESGLFCAESQLRDIAGITVCDGYLEGERISASGEIYKVRYYWDEDGELLEESEADETAEAALAFAKLLLEKDDISVTYFSEELVDKVLCKKYAVTCGGESDTFVLVNYNASRLFASGDGDVYFEYKPDGDTVRKDASFARDTYDGVPYGYMREAYGKLNTQAKEYYDEMYRKVSDVESFTFDGEDAVSALEALLADNPVFDAYFAPEVKGESVRAVYFCSWEPFADPEQTDPERVRAAKEEFDEYIGSIVSALPNGLGSSDQYVFLAQKMQVMLKEHHEHGLGDNFGTLIKADSDNERYAKTFCYICEKANLYCKVTGSTNIIKSGAEDVEVDLHSACRCIPGADDWKAAFYMN